MYVPLFSISAKYRADREDLDINEICVLWWKIL